MKLTFTTPIGHGPHPGSPEVHEGKEAIRLTAKNLSFDGATVAVDLAATFLFPGFVSDRYRNIEEALVLCVHDIEQADGGAIRTENTFITYSEGEHEGPNQQSEPPLPMPGRGTLEAGAFGGGWFDASLTFPCAVAVPRYRPSVYLYLILENYVSNVIGLDLVDKKVVDF